MKKLLRILRRARQSATPIPAVAVPVAHVVGPGRLHVEQGRLCISTDSGRQAALNVDALEVLLAYGAVEVSPAAWRLLAEHGVNVALVSANGQRLHARLETTDRPRVLLRVLQHHTLREPQTQQRLAARIVQEKIHSQIAAVRHYQRQGRLESADALSRLQEFHDRCSSSCSLDELRGLEGSAAQIWYTALAKLLRKPWRFAKRTRRPPADPVNALLSLGYTCLYQRTAVLVEAAGLESTLGTLHAFRSGRLSLACDLMEPLRVTAVDRWVIHTCNQLRYLDPERDFESDESGGVKLTAAKFDEVLAQWERQWYERDLQVVLDRMVRDYVRQLRELGEHLPGLKKRLERGQV
jgi:CRISPR-associated protein Cas1